MAHDSHRLAFNNCELIVFTGEKQQAELKGVAQGEIGAAAFQIVESLRPRALGLDLIDSHASKNLAMTSFAAEILAPAHLLDNELRPLHRSEHFGRDHRTRQGRLAKFKRVATDRQDAVERHLAA